jgi:hypothetical protein
LGRVYQDGVPRRMAFLVLRYSPGSYRLILPPYKSRL